MFTFETSDQKGVRRFRVAQFNGRTATVRSAGSPVTGHVRSIRGKQVERSGGVDHHDHPGRAQADARVAARAARPVLHGRPLLNGRMRDPGLLRFNEIETGLQISDLTFSSTRAGFHPRIKSEGISKRSGNPARPACPSSGHRQLQAAARAAHPQASISGKKIRRAAGSAHGPDPAVLRAPSSRAWPRRDGSRMSLG